MPLAVMVFLVILALGLVWLIYSLVWGTPPNINLAVERLAFRMVMADPEILTTIGLIDNTALDFHSGKLTDASPRDMAHHRRLDRDGLALIRRYASRNLTGQKRLTYQIMRWYFEQNLRGHRFGYHWTSDPVFMGPYPVNHVFGVQIDLINFLSTYHKISSRKSARRYLQRLKMVEWKLDGLKESMELRASQGVYPPRFVVEKSLAQVDSFLSTSVEQNILLTSFIEKAARSGRFGNVISEKWAKRVQRAIENEVLPAYQKLKGFLMEMLEKTTDADGVWKLPDGKAYYVFLLRAHTTTDLTAEEIHRLGLDEVNRLTESIRQVLHTLNLPVDEPGKQLRALMESPEHHYSGEGRRQAIIQDYQKILDEVNQHMPTLFNHGKLEKIVVKRLPEYKEPDSPIAYAQPPALDGSRPGTMWINLRDPDNVYRWGMHTLAYHEGIPGHVYQMTQAQKIKGIPTFRRLYMFNAYVEGWALYAERLGWALNLADRLSNLGRLQALIWRAARLVVDTGIHDQQWTRQEAIDYMIEKTGLPDRDVITEVERYIVMPGQACAYAIGYLKLLSLRQKAEATLGPNFDLREFHDVVINNGGLPLSLLESVVNAYIDQSAGLSPNEDQ